MNTNRLTRGLPLQAVTSGVLAIAALASSAAGQCAVVVDLTPGNANNTNATALTPFFGRELYWSQYLQTSGSELWKWDPANGAHIVVDLVPGSGSSGPERLTPAMLPAGPRLIYSGFEPGHGRELYISDGTAAGTGRLAELRAGSSGSLPDKFVAVRERVFFQANDGSHGDELYITDGTAAGTQMVLDIAPGPSNGRPEDMVALHGMLVFTAKEPTNGRELWISDGTAAGTTLLVDIWPGPTDSNAYQLTRVGDHVYFAANDGVHGSELWRTDGTAAGTELVKNFEPGNSHSLINNLCACGGRLFLTATAPGADGLYVVDGLTTSYLQISNARDLTCSGNRLFFGGDTFSAGKEVWVSDGTVAGTQMIADLNQITSFGPDDLVDVGNGIVFEHDVTVTDELWFTDGTAAGTVHLCTPNPAGSSGSNLLVMSHGHLFFQTYDPSVGREMMYIATPGASAVDLGGASRPDHPRLWLDGGSVPVLGTTIDVQARGPANHAGVLLAGDANLPLPVPMLAGLVEGGYDAVGLQLGTALTLDVATNPTLTWSFQVPANPALEGFRLHFQSLWFGNGAPTLQLSNAVAATLGSAAPH